MNTRPVYLALIVASGLVGWFVPGFYDWTGSDQSRMSPIVPWTAGLLVVAVAAVWLALPWLPIAEDGPRYLRGRPLRFSLRTLLAVTTATAIALGLLKWLPAPSGVIVVGVAYCHAACTAVVWPDRRWALAALLGCMMLPYLWVVPNANIGGVFNEIVGLAAVCPGLFPALFISGYLGRHLEESIGLPMLFTGGELLLGTWLIRRGPRLAIAYLAFVLLISTFGSFCLNALLRS